MIRVPGVDGAAFTEATDGDQKDPANRIRTSDKLGISRNWATVSQVHGTRVVHAESVGGQGEADAIWTEVPGLPVAVFTADCFGVVLVSESAIGVAHAGWRGAAQGIVESMVEEMSGAGHGPTRAVIGPGIGECCFEVGAEVAEQFPEHGATTTWSAKSVELASAIRSQLRTLDVTSVPGCTHHESRWFSHRRDQTSSRMATIAWRP